MKNKSQGQQQEVEAFFDHIASSYPDKLSDKKPFLKHFFNRRIQIACLNVGFNYEKILDIGAGTGILYDFLNLRSKHFDYWACDTSAHMLALSNIPIEKRWVGEVHTFDAIKAIQFDYIFMLGLSTYLTPTQLKNLLLFSKNHHNSKGGIIISFTNSYSIENTLRAWLKRILSLFKTSPKKVLGASFKVYSYTPKELQESFDLITVPVQYIIPGLPFFHHLFPKAAVKVSRFLERFNNQWFYPYICNEFILYAHPVIIGNTP